MYTFNTEYTLGKRDSEGILETVSGGPNPKDGVALGVEQLHGWKDIRIYLIPLPASVAMRRA